MCGLNINATAVLLASDGGGRVPAGLVASLSATIDTGGRSGKGGAVAQGTQPGGMMAISGFVKRKLAMAYYRFDYDKDGVVTESDFVHLGQEVARLRGVEPGSVEADKIVEAHRGWWDTYFKEAPTHYPYRGPRWGVAGACEGFVVCCGGC
jgi:hypothetical protein